MKICVLQINNQLATTMNTIAKASKLSDLHVRIDNAILTIAKVEKELDAIMTAAAQLGISTEREHLVLPDGSTQIEPRTDWLARVKKAIVLAKYEAMTENALKERPEAMRTKSRVGNFFSTVGELIG